MSFQEITDHPRSSSEISRLPARDRVGLVIRGNHAAEALAKIRESDQAGVAQVWMTAISVEGEDTLTILEAAAAQTSRIRLGTAIVPIYTRHPVVMAQQALAINDLAPGRFVLGVGVSHRRLIEQMFGIEMLSPLQYLREYVAVLRDVLWRGKVDHHGRFLNISYVPSHTAPVPVMVSALGPHAFRVAGEISDGAISWICPVPYLLSKAIPALREGAAELHRPSPPTVANILVAISADHEAAKAAALKTVQRYSRAPFYVNMFKQAGTPLASDGSVPSELVEGLLVHGDEAKVESRLREFLEKGLDQLMVTPLVVKDEKKELKQLLDLLGSL